MDDPYPVQSTETAFRVVETLAELEGAGVTELADRLELSKSGVHNHLTTLVRLGYCRKDGTTYRVGLRFLDIGVRARNRAPIARAARDELDGLAAASGEVASAMIEERGEGVYLFTAGTPDPDGPMREGRRVPLHACAAGKAILAHRPETEYDRLIDDPMAATEKTITDRGALSRELQTVRDRGVAYDRGEQAPGYNGVAAPIRRGDRAVGAIAVGGAADRLSGKRLEEDVTGLVVSTANAIEVSLAAGSRAD